MSTRARPASTAAEMAILGSILLDNQHYQQAAGASRLPTSHSSRIAASFCAWAS